MHRLLMTRRIHVGREPYAGHVLPGSPFGVRCSEPYDCPALFADQILAGNADGPTEACSLSNDLVSGVDRFGATNPGNRFHLLDRFEQFHSQANTAQL